MRILGAIAALLVASMPAIAAADIPPSRPKCGCEVPGRGTNVSIAGAVAVVALLPLVIGRRGRR